MTDPTPAAGDAAPLLSVVVTVVDGGDVLRRFLGALLGQVDPPTMEILLPFDASIAETAAQQRDYPAVRLLDMGAVATEHPLTTGAGQHELYDRRRAYALHRARGTLVAILEDRAPPRPDWARAMVRLHAEHPHAVIGGAIDCAAGDLLNWAFWACDFSRYGRPFDSGPRGWISDVNVCYKRRAIDATRDIWVERFNEAKVHWRLMEHGETLFLTSEAVVDYHTRYNSLPAILPERFHWGRLFGHVRGRHVGLEERIALVVFGPLIPLVVLARHGRTHYRRGQLGRFLKAAPRMLVLLSAWAAGEVWGIVTLRP